MRPPPPQPPTFPPSPTGSGCPSSLDQVLSPSQAVLPRGGSLAARRCSAQMNAAEALPGAQPMPHHPSRHAKPAVPVSSPGSRLPTSPGSFSGAVGVQALATCSRWLLSTRHLLGDKLPADLPSCHSPSLDHPPQPGAGGMGVPNCTQLSMVYLRPAFSTCSWQWR